MRDMRHEEGFTLVELLVALMVTSIIFVAVGALAYTLGAVNDATNDMAEKQAQVRYATLRISELVRHSKLICGAAGNSITIWKSDDNNNSAIDTNEKVYVEAAEGGIRLRESNINQTILIPQCSNVQFQFDEPALPVMERKFVSISFDVVENGVTRRYEIGAALRGWSGNLLNAAGTAVSSDDD
jgi:prepilin-type N-terminal cleavage/methylation domain-containing protein